MVTVKAKSLQCSIFFNFSLSVYNFDVRKKFYIVLVTVITLTVICYKLIQSFLGTLYISEYRAMNPKWQYIEQALKMNDK